MPILKPLLATLAAVFLTIASAQAGPTEIVAAAIDALSSSDYLFSYDVWPGLDATSKVAGSGEFDRDTQGWHYTRQSDPADTSADLSKNGEWIMALGSFYFNDGSGWQPAGPDSTYMGITFAPTPFEMYPTLSTLADPEANNLEELALVGSETVEGVAADHYAFATTDMPVLGTGQFDIWITPSETGYERIIIDLTTAEGHTDRVIFTAIGEEVSIEAPQ